MKVVIVAKTRMGSGACVGALTFDGRSLRLIAADQDLNDHFNMDYQVGEVWEIETRPDREIIPPHFEIFHISPTSQLARGDNRASIVPARTRGDALPSRVETAH